MWKTVFGLHLQEKPPLRFLRGFPARFLLPPLSTRRESRAVSIARGSWTPWHWRDKMADPSALTPQSPVPPPLPAEHCPPPCSHPRSSPAPPSQKLPPQQRLFALLRAACLHSWWVPCLRCFPQDGCLPQWPPVPLCHPCPRPAMATLHCA